MQRPRAFVPGKPVFPTDVMIAGQSIDHFLGPQSWLLFELLGANGVWLTQPPDQWDTDPEFQQMKEVVQNLAVVNDTAERGVKDVIDYANAARDGGQ